MTTDLIDGIMRVYSGDSRLCDVGIPTEIKDMHDKPLFTGDIVALVTDEHGYKNVCGITVVVSNQWNGSTTVTFVEDGKLTPFIMGIRSVDLTADKKWQVHLVKSHKDVIDGEHWKAYGFKYKKEAA